MARFWSVYAFTLRVAAWFARQGALFAALFCVAYVLNAGFPGAEDTIGRTVLVAAGIAGALSALVARSLRLGAESASRCADAARGERGAESAPQRPSRCAG